VTDGAVLWAKFTFSSFHAGKTSTYFRRVLLLLNVPHHFFGNAKEKPDYDPSENLHRNQSSAKCDLKQPALNVNY
jgi:hypothetical protein